MQTRAHGPRITAVLGPTNTGKTHFAMERMLAHPGGMIGFPLRLLARENYERAVRAKGASQVALITGEEKIAPPGARWFLCTVEAMPVDRRVPFLAVDEIQMCADPDRGHVFTERLLEARGTEETMFMGAETIRPVLRDLVPGIEFVVRPRLSGLAYAGERKITRLPRRSVVVAFSAADVYAIAELIRRQRGGAAVVLGALSPRTRNAQVGMYQAGEVDHLVATDAIGMGLNMDVDHVAFAETRKFDGRVPRSLTPPELAQIAGRAGRHMRDGTFGVTGEVPPFDPELVDRLENHRFDRLRAIFWRNPKLRFVSLDALQASLGAPPERPGLMRARTADDELALAALARDPEVAGRADHPDLVRLLWDVCCIPDFGKVLTGAHARLLKRIFQFLADGPGRLPTDWVAGQVARLERTDGEIDAIVQRIAHVRTWTYVSHRADWMHDAAHWQERTRALEDKLSDALHERLTNRFVDRRTAVLARKLKDHQHLVAAVAADGQVLVEGHFVGRLEGFRFLADAAATGPLAARTVSGAALKALRGEIARRAAALEEDAQSAFALEADGVVTWRSDPVARLARGPDPLRPRIEADATDLLEPIWRERLLARLGRWLEGYLQDRLTPLGRLRAADLAGAARGVAYQVAEHLGSMPRGPVAEQVAALTREDRKALRKLGLLIGRESLFMPDLLKPAAVDLRALLWSVHDGRRFAAPVPGRMSVPVGEAAPEFLEAVGYRPLGPLAVRVDMVERIAEAAWEMSKAGPFAVSPALLSLAGCSAEAMGAILARLGYAARAGAEGALYARRPPRPPRKPDARPSRRADADSPFAKLKDLVR